MKKKYIVFLVSLTAAMVIFAFLLTACKTEAVCDHDWTDWAVVYEATCTTEGLEERYCNKCPEVETRIIPIDPDAHVWDVNAEVLEIPSCDEEGVRAAICLNCGVHGDSIILPKDPDNHRTPNLETGVCTSCHALLYGLGDMGPGGGKIFYVADGAGTPARNPFTLYITADDTVGSIAHYLEAAPADMATTLAWISDDKIPLDPEDDWLDILGTTAAIGTGRKNTALILDADPNAPAAKACHEFNVAGKTKNDWFLPSSDELYQLYFRFAIIGNLHTTDDDDDTHYYWSSTQEYPDEAIARRFDHDIFDSYMKNRIMSVRAIRAF